MKLQYHKQQQSRHSTTVGVGDRQLAAEADSDDMMRGDGTHMGSSNENVFSKSEASFTLDCRDQVVQLIW